MGDGWACEERLSPDHRLDSEVIAPEFFAQGMGWPPVCPASPLDRRPRVLSDRPRAKELGTVARVPTPRPALGPVWMRHGQSGPGDRVAQALQAFMASELWAEDGPAFADVTAQPRRCHPYEKAAAIYVAGLHIAGVSLRSAR